MKNLRDQKSILLRNIREELIVLFLVLLQKEKAQLSLSVVSYGNTSFPYYRNFIDSA